MSDESNFYQHVSGQFVNLPNKDELFLKKRNTEIAREQVHVEEFLPKMELFLPTASRTTYTSY